jgi:5-methylcytosine-specific restriction enzyme A
MKTKPKDPVERSPLWAGIRKKFLKTQPKCQYCGGLESLEVHHVIPFHIDRTKELDKTNLITLCEAENKQCHLRIGHFGSWKKINPDIRAICEASHKIIQK